jgi:hypothetical protein
VAAPTITEPTPAIASTANATSYATASFTPSANSLLIVASRGAATGTDVNSVSGGSLTWTEQKSFAVGTHRVMLHTAPVGGSPSAMTITVDYGTDAGTGCIIFVMQAASYDSVRQTKGAGASSTDPTITFDSALLTGNSYCVAAFVNRNPAGYTKPNVNWTDLNTTTGHATPASGGHNSFREGGETTDTITFTGATGAWGMVGIEVAAVVVGRIMSSLAGSGGLASAGGIAGRGGGLAG